MTRAFTESVVEEDALAWQEAIGWRVVHGPDMYAELVQAPKPTLQRDLQELVRKGLLIKHGTAKATWYEAGQ